MIKKIIQNILLILIIFLLGNTLISGITIYKTVNNITNDIYSSFTTLVTIQGESFYETHQEDNTYYRDYEEYKTLINELSKDERVKFSSINTMLNYCYLEDIIGRSTSENYDASIFNNEENFIYYQFISEADTFGLGGLIGTNTSELIDELTNHIELVDGRYFTEEEIANSNVAIIPYNLVTKNGDILQVGDTITVHGNLSGPNYIRDELFEKGYQVPTVELEVVGTFKVIDKEHDTPPYDYCSRIYTTNKVVENFSNQIISSIEEFTNINDLMQVESDEYFPYFLPNTILPPYYELNNYKDVEEFVQKCNQLLSETNYIKDYYVIISTNDTINRIVEPLEGVEKMANVFAKASFIALGILMFLIVGLFTKNRTKEIAIYRALGQSNKKIILKFCGEIMLTIIISLGCIQLCAPSISSFISNKLIETINIEEKLQENNLDYFSSGQYILDPLQKENDDIFKNFEIEITNKEYLICSGYIMVISLLGCGLIIIKIIRTNVKDALL